MFSFSAQSFMKAGAEMVFIISRNLEILSPVAEKLNQIQANGNEAQKCIPISADVRNVKQNTICH